jgi:hypothetical protein
VLASSSALSAIGKTYYALSAIGKTYYALSAIGKTYCLHLYSETNLVIT